MLHWYYRSQAVYVPYEDQEQVYIWHTKSREVSSAILNEAMWSLKTCSKYLVASEISKKI